MSFGHRLFLADVLWLRSIQDFDYCDRRKDERNCRDRGWLYQMLVVILKLDPKYFNVYSYGALSLSIIISDIEGASRIYQKALEHFPKDWRLSYKAAYHALFEEKNTEKAAELMEASARHGAPDWVYSLALKLYTQAGRQELARRLLDDLRENSSLSDEMLKRLEARAMGTQ